MGSGALRRAAAAVLVVLAAACCVATVDPRVVTGADQAGGLRAAVRAFTAAERTPRGFDNGVTRARRSDVAQAQLADVSSRSHGSDAAQAYDLLGVLAWGGTTAPAGVVAPADRSVAAFTSAVRADPSDLAAKVNLELALRALAAHGTRTGSQPGTGTGRGNRGAGAGGRGRGY